MHYSIIYWAIFCTVTASVTILSLKSSPCNGEREDKHLKKYLRNNVMRNSF